MRDEIESVVEPQRYDAVPYCVPGVALRADVAGVVVGDLSQRSVAHRVTETRLPPSALEHLDAVGAHRAERHLAVFLDYDGTLTPIVEHPEAAYLSASMRSALSFLLKARVPVAVISGRDLADVAQRVGLDGVYYAGCHGFDIAGPPGCRQTPFEAEAALPALDAAELALRETLCAIDGAQVERKRFAVAAHYRRVRDDDVARIEVEVNRVRASHTGLRCSVGKKVLELLPDIDWDKGCAVDWLLGELGLDRPDVVPLYIGDDLTDEDAFRAVERRGVGIVVCDAPRVTRARYRLAGPAEVEQFLRSLAAGSKGSG